MPWYKTKVALMAAVALLLAAAGLVAKRIFWPVTDSIFQLDYRKLERAPDGIVLLRPTHFSNSAKTGMFATGFGDHSRSVRMIGRNVTLSEVMQMAYDCDPSRIVLPSDATKGAFDFLITAGKPQERLRTAVEKKLGYVAHHETRQAAVFQLVVKVANAPGLKRSTVESGGVEYDHGKLYYKHQPVAALVRYLEQMLKQPVRDKTGLTGFFDYCVEWNLHVRTGTPKQEDFEKSLHAMGLTLMPARESLDMLVVEGPKN